MDRTTEMLASYACRLSYEELGPKTVHQVKRTLVDTMGCAMGGFVSEPAKIARAMASSVTSTARFAAVGYHAYCTAKENGLGYAIGSCRTPSRSDGTVARVRISTNDTRPTPNAPAPEGEDRILSAGKPLILYVYF